MKELDKNFTLEELAAFVDTYRQQNNTVTTPPERGIIAMTEAAADMVAKLNNRGAFAGAKRHTNPEDKACQCNARRFNRKCVCAELVSFSGLAAKLNISCRALYGILHREEILFRHSKINGESDKGGEFGYLYVYAKFGRLDLFVDTAASNAGDDDDENGETYYRGAKASELMVTVKGQALITAIVNNRKPSALQMYRKLFDAAQ
jgi:hypothetical protein